MTDNERIALLRNVLNQFALNIPEAVDATPGATGGLSAHQMAFVLGVIRVQSVAILEATKDEGNNP